MAAPAVEVSAPSDAQRSWPRLWLAAGVEIGVAVVVGVVLFASTKTTSSGDPHSGMHTHVTPAHWSPAITAAAAATAVVFLWWLLSRNRISAALSAVGLICLAASEPVRVIALRSHLVGMVVLEILLVAAPLLLISARRGSPATVTARSSSWTLLVVAAVAGYAALLIGLHLPGVHTNATALQGVPLWLVMLTVGVGIVYWAAILRTGGRVATTARVRALIIGQEVAAILGLAAVILPAPIMAHDTVFGLSGVTDQRLGGVVMLLTCAAVTLPLARRLQSNQPDRDSRTERNVA
ncbi:hypothetical protein [Mycolicibacterium holsaticum]|uniref:Uncharacterized protein n=1 Tax=Mycolicibacterium holsaticum TaxID=152142 RepID=A0A1E3RSL3_9MYCO|nr:hypothetical protein [Mycolicibacterium holsaticum]ODQ92893.1 hypothetical protein BHQ17_15435 [Mycolicibacterium holsaticum]